MKHKVPSAYILSGILIPAVSMFGVRYMGQGASESQAAAVAFETPQITAFPEISFDSIGTERDLQTVGKISSPFWFQEMNESLYMDPIHMNDQSQPDQPESFEANFVVSTILPHTKNPLAIIDSKPRKIGDKVDDDWELIAINGGNRTVTLVHKSGKRVTLHLNSNP